VETGNLPVIGLRDIMCHVAAVLKTKAAGEVKRGYVITTPSRVKWLHLLTAHDCINGPRSLIPPPGYSSTDVHLDSPHAVHLLLPSRDERNLARCNCTEQQPV